MSVIITRKKVKNIILRIDKENNILISAPHSVPEKTIYDFINSKKDWINAHLKLEGLYYLGEKTDKLPSEKEIKDFLSKRFYYICDQMQINPVPTLDFKSRKNTYGFYTKQSHKVTLKPELIMAPLICIDFVIVHELCHIKHFNHSKEFHSELKKYMPHYKDIQKVLSRYPI